MGEEESTETESSESEGENDKEDIKKQEENTKQISHPHNLSDRQIKEDLTRNNMVVGSRSDNRAKLEAQYF